MGKKYESTGDLTLKQGKREVCMDTGEGRFEGRLNMDREKDIKKTLKNILEFIGADLKYAKYAQLHVWLEQLIKRNT